MVIGISRQLKERDWDVQTAFPGTDRFDALFSWARYFGVKAEKAPASLLWNMPRSRSRIAELARFIRKSDAEIVNIHNGVSHASWKDVLAARLAGKRTVTSIHGSRGLDPATEQRQVKATRLAATLSESVVVVTEWSRNNLIDCGLPAKKVKVVPCGLPVPDTIPEKAAARAKFGVDDDAFVLTTAARMVPEKGIGDFVEAAGRLSDPKENLQVLAAGIGDHKDEFEARGKQLLGEKARFLGHVEDVSSLYAATDVFVLATHAENCGLVYREAALHGIPVIGTAVGGNRETILDGKTGLIVPPQDVEALAGAMARLRDDPALRRQLGSQARERAMVEFTEKAMAERYEKVFRYAA
ncbi:MAG TPA: glycosyltransferase family 4 protein [Capsulimonadaceae bacterium]|nr:glycosyltransferase family 4 protein [Capsulimonadaceae bacterium]